MWSMRSRAGRAALLSAEAHLHSLEMSSDHVVSKMELASWWSRVNIK